MNYLVHLYLSGTNPEIQLGGLMGDFVKGPIPASYPEKISLGVQLHRRIDSLAHISSFTRQSRQRLHPKHGHGRGIIVDIFYDHFLATCWTDYARQPLEAFAAEVYTLLQKERQKLPSGLGQIAPRMIEQNWLLSYRQPEVIGKALQRIARRLSRPLPLADAVDDLHAHEDALRGDFHGFMGEATGYIKREFGGGFSRP